MVIHINYNITCWVNACIIKLVKLLVMRVKYVIYIKYLCPLVVKYIYMCVRATLILALIGNTTMSIGKKLQTKEKMRKLYWLVGRHSTLDLTNKQHLYITIIKPIWTYGIQLWGCVSKSDIKIIQRCQILPPEPWFRQHTGLTGIKSSMEILTNYRPSGTKSKSLQTNMRGNRSCSIPMQLSNKTSRQLARYYRRLKHLKLYTT